MLEQKFTYTCSVCGVHEYQDQTLYDDTVMLHPDLPDEWHEIEGAHICPRHQIEMLIDGKPLIMTVAHPPSDADDIRRLSPMPEEGS